MKRHQLIILLILFATNMHAQQTQITPPTLIPFCNQEGLWGYMQPVSKKIVVQPKYNIAFLFKNNVAKVGIFNPTSSNKSTENEYIWGLINETGKEIIPPAHFFLEYGLTSSNDLPSGMVYADGGLFSTKTERWIFKPGEYKDFEIYNDSTFLCNKQILWIGNSRYTCPDSLHITTVYFEHQCFEVSNANAQKGMYTFTGKLIAPVKYMDIAIEGDIIVAAGINADKKFTTKKQFLAWTIEAEKNKSDLVKTDFFTSDGQLLKSVTSQKQISIAAQYGYYNSKGIDYVIDLSNLKITTETAIPVKLSENRYLFIKDGKKGIKDKANNELIPALYYTIKYVNDETFIVVKETKVKLSGKKNDDYADYYSGIINNNNQILVPIKYRSINKNNTRQLSFTACENVTNQYGVIDITDKVIIPFMFDREFYFDSSGQAIAHKSYSLDHAGNHLAFINKYGVIDVTGKEIIPFEYIDITNTKQQYKTPATYYIVTKDGVNGLYNSIGKELIKPQYQYLAIDEGKFIGWIRYKDANRQYEGLINIYTGIKINNEYSHIIVFDKYVKARKDTNNEYITYFLTFEGKEIFDTPFNSTENKYGFWIVKQNKKFGLLDSNLNIVLPIKYDLLHMHDPFILQTCINNRTVYVDLNGVEYTSDK